jgi:hypothetical protein
MKSQRIRQWESGNLKLVLDEIEDNPVETCFEKESFKGVEEPMQLETESCDQKQSEDQLAQKRLMLKNPSQNNRNRNL